MKKIILIGLFILLLSLTGCTDFEECIDYCADMNDCVLSIMDSNIECYRDDVKDIQLTDAVKERCFNSCASMGVE